MNAHLSEEFRLKEQDKDLSINQHNREGFIKNSGVFVLLSVAISISSAFAKPITVIEILDVKDKTTSRHITRDVVRLARDINGIQVNCKPSTDAYDNIDRDELAYLNFSFKLEKLSSTKVKVTVTSSDEENPIGVGGSEIITVGTGDEFTYLAIGDDGREVITFATPGKNFEEWGSSVHGVCDEVSVNSYKVEADALKPEHNSCCKLSGLKECCRVFYIGDLKHKVVTDVRT